MRSCGGCSENQHRIHPRSPHFLVRRRGRLQCSLPRLSGHWNAPVTALCQILCPGQHRARSYKGFACSFKKRVQNSSAQYVDIPCSQFCHHRIRRFRRCRGSDCLHRSSYRFQSRALYGPVLQEYNHSSRMRSSRRCGGHIQGSSCRSALHTRNTAFQHLDVLHPSAADFNSLRNCGFLHFSWRRCGFCSRADAIRNAEHTVLHRPWALLCSLFGLFHPLHTLA